MARQPRLASLSIMCCLIAIAQVHLAQPPTLRKAQRRIGGTSERFLENRKRSPRFIRTYISGLSSVTLWNDTLFLLSIPGTTSAPADRE